MPGYRRPVSPLDPPRLCCDNAANPGIQDVSTPKTMTEAQRAYEAKRAAKAGMSLDKWLAAKERDRVKEEQAKAKAAEPVKPPKPPGFFSRLIERAQKPLG
jgi:hypothetical protein